MNNETKQCIQCDQNIKATDEYCEYCGATQPSITAKSDLKKTVSTDTDSSLESEDEFEDHKKKAFYTRWWFWTAIIACLLIIYLPLHKYVFMDQPQLAADMKNNLYASEQYGNAKVTWNKQLNLFQINIDNESSFTDALTADGGRDTWNRFKKQAILQSQKLAHDHGKANSYLEYQFKSGSTTFPFLIIYNGHTILDTTQKAN
ncbi:hypothetical protein OXT66_04145 [Lentilactobacillus senioris]|uniref:hypothetical protein n=1 Tax=Lentilactobacillus senioris TaxID=931534 RepID=UPI002280D3B9|nr:hypothetical protein [Lentilactobacillus senioris]MCY9806737.1 hypothetical protein [Lentilactobacillus senioris]